MNLLKDGTGWILPPRCATRWTTSLLWKYGLVKFNGHMINKKTGKPKKIVMNIRHPYARFYSYWRMIAQRTDHKVTLDDYIWNLIEEKCPVHFTNNVEWKTPITDNILRYPIPLATYTKLLAPWKVDHFVRVERLEKDLASAGYPVKEHKWSPKEGYGPNMEPSYEKMLENPKYLEVLVQFYGSDLQAFGYN